MKCCRISSFTTTYNWVIIGLILIYQSVTSHTKWMVWAEGISFIKFSEIYRILSIIKIVTSRHNLATKYPTFSRLEFLLNEKIYLSQLTISKLFYLFFIYIVFILEGFRKFSISLIELHFIIIHPSTVTCSIFSEHFFATILLIHYFVFPIYKHIIHT